MTITEAPPFDPTLISASRVDKLLTCGVAFKYHYIDRLPAETSGSAALYGQAIHRALETWAPNREESLDRHTVEAWQYVTVGTVLHDFLIKYDVLARKANLVLDAICRARPNIKQPRQTKDFKDSAIAGEISRFVISWLPYINQRSLYRFTERDSLTSLYEDSLRSMEKYEAQWRHLPAPLETEFNFSVEWNGFVLNGYIDSIELVVDIETGQLAGLGIVDYKTYAREPAEYKDWRQGVIYTIAVEELLKSGDLPSSVTSPLLWGVDYTRLGERRYWEVTEGDKLRLLGELEQYRDRVTRGEFLPACKSANAEFCDYPSICCQKWRPPELSQRVTVNV